MALTVELQEPVKDVTGGDISAHASQDLFGAHLSYHDDRGAPRLAVDRLRGSTGPSDAARGTEGDRDRPVRPALQVAEDDH